MRTNEVEALLVAVRDGTITVDSALGSLRDLPFSDLGFARLDTHREFRQGIPEAIYAESKTPEEVVAIAKHLLAETSGAVIATRVPPETHAAMRAEWPEMTFFERARLAVLRRDDTVRGLLVIVAAGTSDLPVAEEVGATAQALGVKAEYVTDVGVAGAHRIVPERDRLHQADVVVVVAGMDGALPSLVGGMTPAPVIAVPTSVGYGASFEGLAALLTMLNSCAAGVVVCNIDNGFGAAVAALRILNQQEEGS
jgi:NCAIR mutase (PurE)-related protein